MFYFSKKFVKQWPLFYKLQLAQESNHCGMVEASDVGFVQIKIKTSVFARNDAKFKAELRHRHRLPSSGNNTELQKNIFHYSTDVHEVRYFWYTNRCQVLLYICSARNDAKKSVITVLKLHESLTRHGKQPVVSIEPKCLLESYTCRAKNQIKIRKIFFL